MAIPPEEASRDFLRHLFADYYSRKPSYGVDTMHQREWMWHPFEGSMQRHLKLYDQAELAARLANFPPLHVYHSLACYTHPEASDMQVKHRGRLSWELLLDIDVKADPSASRRESLSDALEKARRQFITTLQILERDLGVTDGYAACFSGAKGFHCRITRPQIQGLSPEARRELGRLVGGCNTDLAELFPSLEPGRPLFPSDTPQGGLKRRIHLAMTRIRTMANGRQLSDDLLRLCERHQPPMADARTILSRIGRAKPQEILDNAADNGIAETWFAMARELACPSIDQSAIADASRLVRLRGSLNGRTGLVCKPLAGIDEVESFDPLEDANPHPRDMETQLVPMRDARLAAGGQTWTISSGRESRLPTHIAAVFVATGAARPVPEAWT